MPLSLGRLAGRASLDRGRPAVAACAPEGVAVPRDLDPPRLALLGLWDRHLEHAIVEGGLDLVRIDAVGQRQRAAELAERALEPEETLLLALVFGLALAGERERPVVELDRDVLLLHAGQIGLEHVVVVGLDEIHLRNPPLRHSGLLPKRIEEPVELSRERLRTNKKIHNGHLLTQTTEHGDCPLVVSRS